MMRIETDFMPSFLCNIGVNKADLKEGSYPTLNEIVAALNAQPTLGIEIQGPTGSTGKHDGNIGLRQFQGKLPTPGLGQKTF